MDKQIFFLRNEQVRRNLIAAINQLPLDDHHPITIRITDFDRSLLQNSMFHALCGDVAKQALWMEKERNLVQWKTLFVSGHAMATGMGAEVVPGLEGEFCNIRESTAKMGIKRMTTQRSMTGAAQLALTSRGQHETGINNETLLR
ncbi:TPA: recombination protein NinB [Yersinia enterocolitica]|nr:recombination protein NinB [Yersinia enterocolitica]